MPIDHVALFIPSPSFSTIITFYDALLAPLNYKRHDFIPNRLVGYAADGKSYDFWIHSKSEKELSPTHFCFKAETRDAVEKFHAEGVKAGGKSNGEPGVRKMYHETYYAAYVVDPCG